MSDLAAPPVLSTPAEHVLEEPNPPAVADGNSRTSRSDDELRTIYEIDRTAREIRAGGWSRIALQFPDSMLHDAPWVVETLNQVLLEGNKHQGQGEGEGSDEKPLGEVDTRDAARAKKGAVGDGAGSRKERLYVLADTSYSACCVDEIAAEHVDADVVVHYGRSCLSPTARLPVIYVFTRYPLDHDAVIKDFEDTFRGKDEEIVLVADIIYQDHVPALFQRLGSRGYTSLLSTGIIHDPSGTIPNRKLVAPEGSSQNLSNISLHAYSAFHISVPPTSLLLALHSRLASLHICPTSSSPFSDATPDTPALLRRRFARVLSLSTAGTIGILVNTLSVANYLSSIEHLRKRIDDAGKKSYTVVVGKLNPAKLANFAEVEGWVVVGCWESGLVEDEKSFFRPVVTPFELGVALMKEEERVWGGEWWGGIERLEISEEKESKKIDQRGGQETEMEEPGASEVEGGVEGEESEPPEFDWRTGRLVSRSRPMRVSQAAAASTKSEDAELANGQDSAALVKRAAGELATVNGVVSPGAEFLRSQRTWQGLGTDFTAHEESTVVEEGRSGVARGYVVGQDTDRR